LRTGEGNYKTAFWNASSRTITIYYYSYKSYNIYI